MIAGMSGAQAAAADLLRARAAEAEQAEPEVDEALVAAATGMFSAFEAFYKARRMYQDGHPALDRFFTQLDGKAKTALGDVGELEVAVTPLGLEHAGHVVYASDHPDHNMWFPLYRDGIRELTFSDGIDRDQISRLCGALIQLAAIKPGAEDDDGEDDAVTLLWDLALEDVSYVAIDSYADENAADEEARARIARIREIVTVSMMKELVVPPGTAGHDLDRARRLKSVALTQADLTVLQRDNLAAIDELPANVREANGNLYALDSAERIALARGIGDEPALEEKLLDAIIHALLADGGEEHGDALCARVEQAFTATVVAGGFARATRLRRQVLEAARVMTDIPLWSKLDAAMASSAALAAIGEAVATREDDTLGDVFALIEVMPPAAAHVLLARLANIEQRRRRRWVCEVIATWGTPAVDAAVAALADSSEELALDLLYLLKCVGSAAAGTALERATRHPAPAVRANALRMLAEMSPVSAIASRLRTAFEDDDPIVRAVALELTVAHRPDGCERWIKQAIDDEDFAELDLGEKKRLFVAYGTVGGDRVAPELLARLEQRNLLQRTAIDEERSAAASALGQIRYEGARAALEKLARGKLVRAIVSDACSEALAELDRPRAEPSRVAPPSDEPSDVPPAPQVTFKIPRPTTATSNPSTASVPRPGTAPTAPPGAARAAAFAETVHGPAPAPSTGATPRVPATSAPPSTGHVPRPPVTTPPASTGSLPRTPAAAPSTGHVPRPPGTSPPVTTGPLPRTPAAAPTTSTTGHVPRAPGTSPPVTTGPLPRTPPASRETNTRPDPRSASGRRPIDDGVVVVPRRPGGTKGPKRDG